MLNEEIRLNNLKLLIKEAGTIVSLADKCDTSPAYISQIINNVASSTGKPRGVGNNLAKKLEDGTNKKRGWIDVDHTSEYTLENGAAMLNANESINNKYSHSYSIRQFDDVVGSMGKGMVLQDQPGQITNIEVTDEWLNKNVPSNTGKKNLCIVTGFGDSMKGMFNPGDPLLVDVGIKKCKHDGVYFFRVGDEGYIKTLQRIPGEGIRVISENKKYETWTITNDMDFEVLAKVLIVWEGTHF